MGKWQRGNQLLPGDHPGEAEYKISVDQLFEEDEENLNAEPVYDYSIRYNFNDKINGRRADISAYKNLVVKVRSLSGSPKNIQVALIDKHGSSFGKTVALNPDDDENVISLADLKPVRTVTLPRPYPTFLQYYFEHNNRGSLNMEEVEAIQISIGPGLDETQLKSKKEIGITSVKLEK